MNRKQITILLTVFVVFVGGTLLFNYLEPKESLCVYEIPNHVKMKCGEGNLTRTVNFFEISLFRYNNALKESCYIYEKLNDSGFRYEIAVCNESIPFKIFR